MAFCLAMGLQREWVLGLGYSLGGLSKGLLFLRGGGLRGGWWCRFSVKEW